MPLHTFDAPPATEQPAPPKPVPVVVCTISESDAGEMCAHCGWAFGVGHGRERG